ncbi:MAG: cell division protein FtsW [Planctomycetota bacterium]|nr:MAG: cell division protein FtsW [Planctomycetota bacterium]
MLRAGHGLMLLTAGLLSIGVIMVNSAGLTVGAAEPVSLTGILLGRTTLLAALAMAMMLIASRLPVDRLYRTALSADVVPWIVIGVVILLLAVHLPGVGREVNGARRWLNLGPASFQPSEVAKWSMVVVLALYAARHVAVMGQLNRGLIRPIALVALVCALIATEDLGTAVLIGVVSVCVLVAAGARLAFVALLAGPCMAGLAAAVMMSPYRIDRVRAFVDPWQDPQGIGYHVIQSMVTVAGGGVAGRGLGNSIQKFGYLPEDTTDFIFAIISEELGLIGVIVVVCLYAAMLLCGLSILTRVEHPFGKLLGLGVLLTIGLQALINMMVVTGLAPTKGIALPLISAGGTGWILTAFCVGLLVAMDKGDRSLYRRPVKRSVPFIPQ